MKIAIRYYTKTGNTKKLAEAIAEAVSVPAEAVDVPLDDEVDILFLGSAVYAAGVDAKIKDFIHSLDREKVRRVVNFSTAALLPSTYSQVSKLLAEKNILLDEREFHCRGRFKFMHKEKPDLSDISSVKKFAEAIVEKGSVI